MLVISYDLRGQQSLLLLQGSSQFQGLQLVLAHIIASLPKPRRFHVLVLVGDLAKDTLSQAFFNTECLRHVV
jgi:hypothetical protein